MSIAVSGHRRQQTCRPPPPKKKNRGLSWQMVGASLLQKEVDTVNLILIMGFHTQNGQNILRYLWTLSLYILWVLNSTEVPPIFPALSCLQREFHRRASVGRAQGQQVGSSSLRMLCALQSEENANDSWYITCVTPSGPPVLLGSSRCNPCDLWSYIAPISVGHSLAGLSSELLSPCHAVSSMWKTMDNHCVADRSWVQQSHYKMQQMRLGSSLLQECISLSVEIVDKTTDGFVTSVGRLVEKCLGRGSCLCASNRRFDCDSDLWFSSRIANH